MLEVFNMTDAQEGDMAAHLWGFTALRACLIVAMADLALLLKAL